MAKQCLIDVPHQPYVDCDSCINSYVEFEEEVFDTSGDGPPLWCRITHKYRWETCFEGLAVGAHVFSITLLPGEEVELEVVRREKFNTALHQQASLEQELELEVRDTTRDEWSERADSGFTENKQNNFSLWGQKRQTIREHTENIERFTKTMSEVVQKAAARVSAKYETSLDIKTEVENRYRAVRKVRNPNKCQPVTFHYYRLIKKFRRALYFVETEVSCVPPAGIAPPRGPGVTHFGSSVRRPQNLRPDIVAPPPRWTRTEPAAAETACGSDHGPVNAETMTATFERPELVRLSREAAVEDIRRREGDEAARHAAQVFQEFDDLADPGGGGLVFEEEICLGTDNFHVEGLVSACAVCEDTELKMKELECKKAELELEKLKCEIALCEMQLKEKPVEPEKPEEPEKPDPYGEAPPDSDYPKGNDDEGRDAGRYRPHKP